MSPDPGARKRQPATDALNSRSRPSSAGIAPPQHRALPALPGDDFWRNLVRVAMLGGALSILGACLGARAVIADSDAATATATMPLYSAMVVFGDSLSDSGNAGHYTNGAPWVEVVAERLGLRLQPSRFGGSNYAVGGALTHGRPTDLRGQVAGYLARHDGRADPQSLYVVYAGTNDLLSAGCVAGRDGAARTAAAALVASVTDLADAGARTILVPNLPDIGYAPVVRAQGAACVAEAGRLTRVFNVALDERLREVEARTHTPIRQLDVYALTERLMANPEAAGFHDVQTPCLQARCDGLLFWDYLHPTAAAHATLARAALDALQHNDGPE